MVSKRKLKVLVRWFANVMLSTTPLAPWLVS